MRMWQVERRKRTRHLIELGELVVKAGIVDLTSDDRALIYGALLWMADKLQSGDQGEQARALWAAKGKQAFEACLATRDATEDERFLALVPAVEREMAVNNGIILRKYFLDVSQDEQRRRFEARINDPVKHWKLSPMDTESVRRWWDYTVAYQRMIKATHTPEAPWYIVPADNKRRARLNLIQHLLNSIPYKKVKVDLPKIPKAQPRPKGAIESLGAGELIRNHY